MEIPMDKSTRRRSVAALLAAVGCLLVMATPVPAVTTTLYLQQGTFDLDVDGDNVDDVVIEFGGEDHSCEDPDQPPISLVADVTDTSTTVEDVTFGDPKEGEPPEPHMGTVGASFFDFAGMPYQLDLSLGDPDTIGTGSNHGTITGTHPNQAVNQELLLVGTIWTVTGSTFPNCEKAAEVCLFVTELNVSGPYNSTTMMHGPLNGSAGFETAFCDSPFAALNLGNADLTGLTLDDTPPT
jgi:hypothetical protein